MELEQMGRLFVEECRVDRPLAPNRVDTPVGHIRHHYYHSPSLELLLVRLVGLLW